METIGVNRLRPDADELVRRAQSGETIAVVVAGRAVAELGPAHPRRWRRGGEIAAIFRGGAEADLDRDALNETMPDRFEAR